MLTRRALLSVFASLVWGLSVAGCTLIGETPSARFYVLAPQAVDAEQEENASGGLAIGVGPVVLPEYVERPHIVTRTGRNSLELHEYDRWAEPLDHAVPSVLSEEIARMLGTERVVTHPWRASIDVDYQVTAQILRFDAETDGPAVLVARWRIYDGTGQSILSMRRSRFTAQSDMASGAEGVVQALNATIGAFAREISDSVTALAKAGD